MTKKSADVVVLGAGLAGLSAALAFARRGRRVLVLERDGPPASRDADGCSSAGSGPGSHIFGSRTTSLRSHDRSCSRTRRTSSTRWLHSARSRTVSTNCYRVRCSRVTRRSSRSALAGRCSRARSGELWTPTTMSASRRGRGWSRFLAAERVATDGGMPEHCVLVNPCLVLNAMRLRRRASDHLRFPTGMRLQPLHDSGRWRRAQAQDSSTPASECEQSRRSKHRSRGRGGVGRLRRVQDGYTPAPIRPTLANANH